MKLTPRQRLIVALDLPDPASARRMAHVLAGAAGMFKVGSQLFTAAGPDFVRWLVERGERVFLDLKFHDIPNTVQGAVASARGLGVSLVDVHGLGGAAMIRAASEALAGSETRLLAITILTSHDAGTLQEVGVAGPLEARVVELARLARGAGAHGVVASPVEIRAIRAACGDEFVIVTPGIRPAGSEAYDQTRLATPRAAVEAGADFIVVGRPILEAADPAAAARAIVAELSLA